MSQQALNLITQSKGDKDVLKLLWDKTFGEKLDDNMAKKLAGFNSTSPTSMNTSSFQQSTMGKNVTGTVAETLREAFQSQMRGNAGMEAGEFQSLETMLDIFVNSNNEIRGIGDIIKNVILTSVEQMILYYKQQKDLMIEINEKVGMTGELSKAFRDEITNSSVQAIRLGISFNELSTSVSKLVTDSGKFKLLDEKAMNDMALASKFAESMSVYAGMSSNFESVSLGINDMNREVIKAGKSSLELGLNSRTTVKNLTDNLDKLNQFGFKNGVEGLTKMTQKSIEFRMNMDSVFKFAEKVWSPEGALDIVSNLQMIGGAFGDMNDPIKLMYMATNNTEGLQDALIGATSSLVTFNQEQGRFEVTGANLRRAKEMADQFGMSIGDVNKMAIAAMERTTAASNLMASGLQMDDEDMEFLTNLARMEGGQMVISVPGDLQKKLGLTAETATIALDKMTEDQAKMLLQQRESFKELSMEDIARQQVTTIENISRDVSFITATMRLQAGRVGEQVIKTLGFDPLEISKKTAEMANDVQKTVKGFGEGVQTTISGMNKSKYQTGNIITENSTVPIPKEEKSKEITKSISEKDKKIRIEHHVSSDHPVWDKFGMEVQKMMMMGALKGEYLEQYSK